MANEFVVNGEMMISGKATHEKNKRLKGEPVFTSRMEKRQYYKSIHYSDIRNVLNVKGLLTGIRENFRTYVLQVNKWIQKNPLKKMIVTGIFTVIVSCFVTNANAAFIQEYTYQVKQGDKIENIAAEHGVTPQEILDANGVSAIAGKKILLPIVQDRIVTADFLNVRSQPNTESSIIGKYQKGEIVKVSFVENGWAGILIKGRLCYVNADYLTQKLVSSPTSPTVTANTKTMYVTALSLKVRAAASTTSAVIGSLKLNNSVTVISSYNGWAKINFNGNIAFVYEAFLKSREPQNEEKTQDVYVIKKGDSFTKISKEFGVSIAAIQELNPTVNSAKLKMGQKIFIPIAITNQIIVTAQIGGVDPDGSFRFITSDGKTYGAKASGNMINELFTCEGKKVGLTLEGKRGHQLTLKSIH